MARVLFIFIDGLGLGSGGQNNPLAQASYQVLRLVEPDLGPFPKDGLCLRTDAGLGVPGLPQSATGQTALFTGQNAALHMGRHLTGFPTPTLREMIRRSSLFSRLSTKGFRMTFANAYGPRFFLKRPRWVSATTVLCEGAAVRLRTVSDLKQGRALYMDLTNRGLIEQGITVPVYSLAEAAEVLLALSSDYDLCLYEFFLTDRVGHSCDLDEAVRILSRLDRFLKALIEGLDLSRQSLVISSDHGNVEDMGSRRHTHNHVPTLLFGKITERIPKKSFSLLDVSPLIEAFLLRSRSLQDVQD